MSQNELSYWEKIKRLGIAIGQEMIIMSRADVIVDMSNGQTLYVTDPEYQLMLAEPEIRRNIVHARKAH